MGFLSDMFSGLWSGSSGGFKAAGRGIDDLAHGDLENTGNELENSYRSMAEVPGSPIAIDRAIYRGENGDLDWNPYSQNNSVWDSGAGGSQMTEDPDNRRTGRMIGTLMAGYGIGSGLTAGAGLSAPVAGATSGAIVSGAQTAGNGGNRTDIGRSMMAGGAAGGIGGYVQGLDLAGDAGISDNVLRGVANGALGGATTSALTPGSDSKDVSIGALFGGARGGLGSYSSNNGGTKVDYDQTDIFGRNVPQQSQAPWANENAGNTYNASTGGGGMSVAPWVSNSSSPVGTGRQNDNPFSDYIDKALGFFKNSDGGWNGQRIDSTVNGLMGLYGGYKRRQAASQLMRGMDQRRNDYSTALQSELMRKDAAAGRRSAYDTRGVELNARLAALDAQQMPTIMNAKNSELSGLFNMISSGYGMARGYGAFGSPVQTGNIQPVPQLDTNTTSSLANIYQPQNYDIYANQESPYTLSGGYNAARRRGGYNGGI